MRFWVFGLLLLICSLPVRGNAADPVGVWRFDEQGFQSALIEMLQAGGFGIVSQVEPPSWAPVMYREGRRVLLLAFKGDGPGADCEAF